MYKCHDSTILFIWSNSLCAIAWYDQISISSFARLIIIFWNYTTRIVIFFFLSKVRERENHLSFFFLVYFRYQTSRFVCSFLLVIFSFLSFFFIIFLFFAASKYEKIHFRFILYAYIHAYTHLHICIYIYIRGDPHGSQE